MVYKGICPQANIPHIWHTFMIEGTCTPAKLIHKHTYIYVIQADAFIAFSYEIMIMMIIILLYYHPSGMNGKKRAATEAAAAAEPPPSQPHRHTIIA